MAACLLTRLMPFTLVLYASVARCFCKLLKRHGKQSVFITLLVLHCLPFCDARIPAVLCSFSLLHDNRCHYLRNALIVVVAARRTMQTERETSTAVHTPKVSSAFPRHFCILLIKTALKYSSFCNNNKGWTAFSDLVRRTLNLKKIPVQKIHTNNYYFQLRFYALASNNHS